jgi:DUF35 OB-fold domain, acyl-CoA-associated
VPYAPAIVDLDEGYQMMTNLIGLPPAAITPGLPVQVEFHETGRGLHLPYFRPRAAADGNGLHCGQDDQRWPRRERGHLGIVRP